jgi:hypothetical protein
MMFKRDYLPRCHWNMQHGRKIKEKRAFETLQDATEYLKSGNLQNQYNVYQCNVCNKWHIGHKIKK